MVLARTLLFCIFSMGLIWLSSGSVWSHGPYAVSSSFAGNRWNIETIVSSGDDQSVSLALDSLGTPHITWQDQESRRLMYSAKVGDKWVIETIDTGHNYEPSIKIDKNGYPHVSYVNWAGVRYATKIGPTWYIETVQENYTIEVSLFLDSSDRPHITYIDFRDSRKLKYAEKTGSNWVIETIGQGCGDPSLFLDSFGNPHISYYTDQGDLKYGFKQNGNWHIETVEHIQGWPGRGFWLSRTSLFLDFDDNPHISYQAGYGGTYALKYATKKTENWSIEMVDWAGWNTWTGYQSSLYLDDEGNPHISYNDGGPGKGGFVKYAVKRGGYWWKEVIDNTIWGLESSLCLDSSGNPHIAYRISYHHGKGVRYAYSSEYYPLNVTLRGTAGQSLRGNIFILFFNHEIYATLNVNANGEARLEHVPIGMYTIKAEYKGFSQTLNVSLNGSTDILIELDIFVEILEVPLTSMQTVLLILTIAIVSVTTIIVMLVRKRRKKGNEMDVYSLHTNSQIIERTCHSQIH